MRTLDGNASDDKALTDGTFLIEKLGGDLSKLDSLNETEKADCIKKFLNSLHMLLLHNAIFRQGKQAVPRHFSLLVGTAYLV